MLGSGKNKSDSEKNGRRQKDNIQGKCDTTYGFKG